MLTPFFSESDSLMATGRALAQGTTRPRHIAPRLSANHEGVRTSHEKNCASHFLITHCLLYFSFSVADSQAFIFLLVYYRTCEQGVGTWRMCCVVHCIKVHLRIQFWFWVGCQLPNSELFCKAPSFTRLRDYDQTPIKTNSLWYFSGLNLRAL